jgi:hypothetical protein
LNEFTVYRSGKNSPEVLVKPDGLIRIHETEADGGKCERTFFLEVDRSTEIQEVLIARTGCYFDYYKSGKFAIRNGASRESYKEFPFRVLMVFKTAERRSNTAERLLQKNLPIFKQVCLSTLEEVIRDPHQASYYGQFDGRGRSVKMQPGFDHLHTLGHFFRPGGFALGRGGFRLQNSKVSRGSNCLRSRHQ